MGETDKSESSNSDNNDDDFSQGFESISLGDGENEVDNNEKVGNLGSHEFYDIDSVEDFVGIVFTLLSPDEINKFTFANVNIAYDFFNEYAKANRFSLRKHKQGHSRQGPLLWKSFVCARQGLRDDKFVNNPNRQREARCNTRCGCTAEFSVHIDAPSSRWYVSILKVEHNHALLTEKFVGRLPSHRTMTDGVRAEMNGLRMAGISTPNIFRAFAQQSGGYADVGFNKKKMYNVLASERKLRNGDATTVLAHLDEMVSEDPKMYWRHHVDNEGKLRHLFWCDGESVIDYGIFGEVLAFDATYGRNKYKCPVVVFSGVNHHRQTVVFGCAVVSDETEQTYVWVLEHFMCAIDGKPPRAVITDGDVAMRNAIERVFPDAHHRLCAWHLLRNAKKK